MHARKRSGLHSVDLNGEGELLSGEENCSEDCNGGEDVFHGWIVLTKDTSFCTPRQKSGGLLQFSCSFSLEEKEPKRIAAVEILPGIHEKNPAKTNEVASTQVITLAEWFS
jgi:hypothetical protein